MATLWQPPLVNGQFMSHLEANYHHIWAEMKENLAFIKSKNDKTTSEKEYLLPGPFFKLKLIFEDGSNITVREEMSQCSEILFDPSLVGLEYKGMHQV